MPDVVALRRIEGLEYLRRAGVTPDERLAEAIDLVASKRGDEGRWLLETRYPGEMPGERDGDQGRPSRWNALRALQVSERYLVHSDFSSCSEGKTTHALHITSKSAGLL